MRGFLPSVIGAECRDGKSEGGRRGGGRQHTKMPKMPEKLNVPAFLPVIPPQLCRLM